MRKAYASEITKDYLIELGVEEVDPAGRYIIVKGKTAPFHNNPSEKRHYLRISLYDPKLRQATPKEKRKNNTGQFHIPVHVINYVWNRGNRPLGYVIDHINNDPQDNRIENLQLLTPAENLMKEKGESKRVIVSKYSGSTQEHYERQLKIATAEYEEAKLNHNAEKAHKLRSKISYYKARLRFFIS